MTTRSVRTPRRTRRAGPHTEGEVSAVKKITVRKNSKYLGTLLG